MHVFAAPIIAHAQQQHLELVGIEQAQEVATNGVQATTISGQQLRVGKSAFIAEVVAPFQELPLTAGETAVYVSCDDRLVGIIVLTDPLRQTTTVTLEWLRERGVDQMVSGDRRYGRHCLLWLRPSALHHTRFTHH